MSRRTGERLAEGLYEDLITEALASDLAQSTLERIEEPLGDIDAHTVLARHLRDEIERAVRSLPNESRAEKARALSASMIEHLATLVSDDAASLIREQQPVSPARRLMALHRGAVPGRPSTPLSVSTLLT